MSADIRRQSKLTSALVNLGAPVASVSNSTALNLSPPGAGRRDEKTSEMLVWPISSTLMQKQPFSRTRGSAEEDAFRQVSIVGLSPSAEIDVIAETVTPPRPAGPSVVTTAVSMAVALHPDLAEPIAEVFRESP